MIDERSRLLYEDTLLEHNRHPRHFRELPRDSNRHGDGYNPYCNDEVSLALRVEDGRIAGVGFDGAGCAIAMASASMLAEAIQGRTEAEARALLGRVHGMLTGRGGGEGLGPLAALAGVAEFPLRVKCASLAWHVLRAALDEKAGPVSTESPCAGPYCPQPEVTG